MYARRNIRIRKKRLLRYAHHYPCGSGGKKHISRAGCACSNRSAVLVVSAVINGRALKKPHFFCRFFAQPAKQRPCRKYFRQLISFYARSLQDRIIPIVVPYTEKLAHRGVGRINRIPAGEKIIHIFERRQVLPARLPFFFHTWNFCRVKRGAQLPSCRLVEILFSRRVP